MDDLTGGTRREERVTGTPDTTIHDPDDTIGGVAGGGGSGTGERATGTPNIIYDLSSVLFHALEGGASYNTYIEDAEREGDQELADFFIQVRDEDSMRADEARRLLAERSPTTTTSATGGASASATGGGTSIESVEGATAPSEGLAAGALRREETARVTEGRPDMDVAPTTPGTGGVGREEPDVESMSEPSLAREGMEEAPPPRTSGIEEGVLPEREGSTGGTPPREGALRGDISPEDTSRRTEDEGPLGRGDAGRPEGEREEDKGLLGRARDAILGEEDEPRRGEGSDRPGERR